ncbi:MAG: hypothetical protein M1131_06950 [Actinobacteria bacterium]|jgi:CcmD family protein|nr:hypothetical protein [Actinomycetota bacterium]MCL6094481.1 hypothetical protein [Actinomycetota bacterium]
MVAGYCVVLVTLFGYALWLGVRKRRLKRLLALIRSQGLIERSSLPGERL